VTDLTEQAAFWVVRLHSDQRMRADEEAFRVWLEQDPAHADAYADCAALWDGVAIAAESEEAHEILQPLRMPYPAPRRLNRRTVLFGGMGAAAAAAAAVVIGPLAAHGEQTFQTKPGKQRRIRLADGSGVLLNTDSKLRVKFLPAERCLFLDRGQAFFQVAKDEQRPFRVFVGGDEVRATGTAFEVRRLGEATLVTLEEGQVAIYRAAAGEEMPSAVLNPGTQVELDAVKPLQVRQVDLHKVQAWRYGRMILDGAPLGETVADLNRYGGIQIVLADPKLASLRVSGVFHTGRPDDFVEAVTSAFPVQVAQQDEETIVLKSR
jgi:transmembrane sensor